MKNVLFFLAVAFTSCNHIYYAPNTANTPLFSEKGESKLNMLYTTGLTKTFNGAEVQFAHAITNNIGVMANAFSAGSSEEAYSTKYKTTYTEKGSGMYGEIAGGYFRSLDVNKHWIGEVYAGVGKGSVKNDYGFGDDASVAITKFFLQPAIGYKSKMVEIALVPKISLVNWKVKQKDLSNGLNAFAEAELMEISSKKSFLAFEPALNLRAGRDNLKWQLSIASTAYDGNKVSYTGGLVETFTGSLGVSIAIPAHKPVQ